MNHLSYYLNRLCKTFLLHNVYITLKVYTKTGGTAIAEPPVINVSKRIITNPIADQLYADPLPFPVDVPPAGVSVFYRTPAW